MSKKELIKNLLADGKAEEIVDLVDQANSGDSSVMPEIRELLDQAPSLISLMGGDLAEQAELSLVRRICGDQLAMKESIKQKLQQLRLELAGPNPTPIERILVERVVACWLHVQFADSQLIQRKEVSFKLGDYLQRQQDRAHRRFLSAIKTLATVRRLALPIQVDVNVSAAARAVDSLTQEPSNVLEAGIPQT